MAKPMTVTTAISAAGRVWLPGQEVTSPKALKRIEKRKLVPLESPEEALDARAADDEQEWYNYRTIKTVKAGVGDDPVRAAYALEREYERDEDRQRKSLIEHLEAVIADDGGDQGGGEEGD